MDMDKKTKNQEMEKCIAKSIKEETDRHNSSITLSAPWQSGSCNNIIQSSEESSGIILSNLIEQKIDNTATYNRFITERTRLHEVYIREEAENKRIGLALAFLLILSASLILLFAPDGRKTLSYWIGTALIIFAAGAAGFGRVWGKATSISFGADQDKRSFDK